MAVPPASGRALVTASLVPQHLGKELAQEPAGVVAIVHHTASSAPVAASEAARTSDSSPVMYTRPVAPIMR
jgi:hypothetical protein